MDISAQFDSRLAKTFRCSRYAERLCAAYPARRDELLAEGNTIFTAAAMRADMRANIESKGKNQYADEAELHRALRKLRQRVMLRLIFRDLNGLADLEEVVATISALADVALVAALDFHQRAVAAAFGLSPVALTNAASQMVIVGMGKLGACELNVSSDIDLVFVYAEDGEATSARSWHEFHAEVGKRVIRALDAVDEDGFVFRVDMRLRPFGDSGPLVASLSSMENYFLAQARPWERYAWLKARAVSGAIATTTALMNLVTPFVYRRYHDYGAIGEMRDLHAQIRAEATKRNRLNDIKVGPGGIREIEFIVQLHQLIRGGREHRLQLSSTRAALGEIDRLGLLEAARVDELRAAYIFLRNLEHRLQYVDDQQTQALPTGDSEQQRIAEGMNVANWPAFETLLKRHRAVVTQAFDALFAATGATAVIDKAGAERAAIAKTANETQTETGLEASIRAVFAASTGNKSLTDGAPKIIERVLMWQNASRTATLSARTRKRIDGLIPAALTLALAESVPTQTFFRVLDLFDAIDKRETYIALLAEYPEVLARVTRIAARSAWAAELLRRHPVLLDELRAPRSSIAAIDWTTERVRLGSECERAAGDTEQLFEILRHTKQVITLKLNIADIEGRLGVMALSDELSALADMLLEAALAMAAQAITLDAAGSGPPRGFAIIGYGKLGSKELGYASDLDLVFLYDASSGISAESYSKIAQRLSSWLNTMTAGGVLYETDLRLRPDGAAGLLVSSLDAFRDYQQARAWTWEHQALTRARWCAGDPVLAAPFEAIRKAVLCAPRDRQKLRAEIVEMRDKMRAEKKDRPDRRDLKHTRGGIVDVEFIVQYLILAYAHEHAEFLGNLGNFALLTRAGALGILDEDIAAQVAKAYLAYRDRQHRARTNNEEKTWIGLEELADERRAVMAAWSSLLA